MLWTFVSNVHSHPTLPPAFVSPLHLHVTCDVPCSLTWRFSLTVALADNLIIMCLCFLTPYIALDGRLASLRSGGLCSPKHYAEFSHLCSVTNYLPSVEYCCCIYETSVLCCRYHQDWNLFRCQLEEDLIDTTLVFITHYFLRSDSSEVSTGPGWGGGVVTPGPVLT